MINKKNKNSSFSLIEKTKISIQRRNVSIHRKEKSNIEETHVIYSSNIETSEIQDR